MRRQQYKQKLQNALKQMPSGNIRNEKPTIECFWTLYFISTYITPMSNPNCYYQSCIRGCCNYQGYCPEDYSFGSQSYCYYYYPTSQTGTISGAVIGAFVGVILILVIACYCYKKRQAAQLMQQQLATGASMNTMQNMNYTQPNQPIYGQQVYGQAQPQYGQPQYGQPQFGQPQFGQPQYGQPQFGQQQPIIVVT